MCLLCLDFRLLVWLFWLVGLVSGSRSYMPGAPCTSGIPGHSLHSAAVAGTHPPASQLRIVSAGIQWAFRLTVLYQRSPLVH